MITKEQTDLAIKILMCVEDEEISGYARKVLKYALKGETATDPEIIERMFRLDTTPTTK